MRRFLLILTLLLVSTHLAVAQGPPDSTRLEAAQQFQQQHGADWNVSWHAKAETPATLMGGKATGYGGPPKQAGRAFLRDNKLLFGIENTRKNLQVVRQNASNGKARVLYRQVYKGVPVLHSGYLVAINGAGAVYYVSGDYYTEIRVSTTPALQPQDVVKVMRDDLGGADVDVLQKPKLSVYVDDEGNDLAYHLAYEAQAESRDPLKAKEYVVDAGSGKVLYETSLIEEVNGSGDVYATNPMHGGAVSKTLYRLRNLSPRELDGDNIVVTNEEASEATSSSGDFSYGTSNTHFDEVMVYRHSDRFEGWLVNLGMGGSKVGKVTAETHSSNGYAFTYPSSRQAYFSDGDAYGGLRNPTREASVITHEYMHVVSETYNSLTQNGEANAMDEGYSDYFGVAYRHEVGGASSTVQGEYIDISGGCDYSRDADNSYTMNDYNTDISGCGGVDEHDRSRIFTGALWDFRSDGSVNATKADEIVLASLAHLDGNPTFLDARNALVTAAGNAGYSQYECDIRSAFADHGIGSACAPPFSVSISGSTCAASNRENFWTANHRGGNSPFDFSWYRSCDQLSGPTPNGTSCQGGWKLVHHGATYSPFISIGESDFQLKLDAYDDDFDHDSDILPINVEPSCPSSPSSAEARRDSVVFDAEPGDIDAVLSAATPVRFVLRQNAPNPFRSQTTLRYGLPETAHVRLTVYDALGRRVKTLASGSQKAGWHRARFAAGDLPAGVYLVRMQAAGSFATTKRMVLVR